jgi:uncharacterized membrane protein YfcA
MVPFCVLVSVLWTILAGGVAGSLGALLGIGGGVFLVPFLNLVLGLDMRVASAISLITVIATSSVTSASAGRLRLVNLRLGMVLEVFTTSGGLIGVLIVHSLSVSTLQWLFGGVTAIVAIVMTTRLDRRNDLPVGTEVGRLGGRYFNEESGREAAYRVVQFPIACAVSLAAGIVSVLGIGGGVLKVPALNAWCGVPLRVAAATSALMIGATALVGAVSYFIRGDIVPHLAGAAVLGVLLGSRLGFAIASRSRIRHQKAVLAAVLAAVSIIFFLKAGQ